MELPRNRKYQTSIRRRKVWPSASYARAGGDDSLCIGSRRNRAQAPAAPMAGDREWNKGWAIHRFGDFGEGLHLVREGVRQWNETGAALHATNYEICLVEIHILQGPTAVARSHLAAAQAHSRRYGENYLAAEMNRLEALVLQCEGAPTAMVHERLANAQAIARQAEARMNSSRRSRRWREPRPHTRKPSKDPSHHEV